MSIDQIVSLPSPNKTQWWPCKLCSKSKRPWRMGCIHRLLAGTNCMKWNEISIEYECMLWLRCYKIQIMLTLWLKYEIEWDRREVARCSCFLYSWFYWSSICTSCKMHDDECTSIWIVEKLSRFQIKMLLQLRWQKLIRPHIQVVQIDSKVNCTHTMFQSI